MKKHCFYHGIKAMLTKVFGKRGAGKRTFSQKGFFPAKLFYKTLFVDFSVLRAEGRGVQSVVLFLIVRYTSFFRFFWRYSCGVMLNSRWNTR